MEDQKKKVEEKYILLQLLDAQIKEVEKELSGLEMKNQELIRLNESFDNLSQLKEGSASYSSISPGVYIKSSITDSKNVLVNIGAGVIVKKSIPDAKAMVDKQLTQLASITTQLAQNLQALANRANEIQKDIQELVEK